MIPSIIQLKQDVKDLKEQILRLERLVLTFPHGECEECQHKAFDILVQIDTEHRANDPETSHTEEGAPNGD